MWKSARYPLALFLSLSLSLVVAQGGPDLQRRYTRLSVSVKGNYTIQNETVESTDDCGLKAANRGAVAFRITARKQPEKLTIHCSLVEKIHGFEELSDYARFYLADRRDFPADGEQCGAAGETVTDIIRNLSKCKNDDGVLCTSLRSVEKYCKEMNNPNCLEPILGDAITTTTPTPSTAAKPKTPCPPSWSTQDQKHCCPVDYQFSAAFQKCVGRFQLTATSGTQADINAVCTQSGGVPVTIENETQNKEIGEFAQQLGTRVAIGYQIHEGEKWTKNGFRWIDGSISNFTKWRSEEPNNAFSRDERITEVLGTGLYKGLWNDRDVKQLFTKHRYVACTCPACPAQIAVET